MAIVTSYNQKKFLILDDLPEMRSSLRSQLASLGCDKVAMSGHVRDALEQFRLGQFDVVLCDYYLGGGTDGQQFLEYLRTRNLISRGTLFIMVTAEKGYEGVVTAAECLPDDYLLKPFTADALRTRLERLLDKKIRLAKVDVMQDRGRWPEVIAGCDEILAAKDRYQVDAMRIKGNALIMAGRLAEAVDFYRQVLAMRALPWARLGLARALHSQGDGAGSEETLTALIAESPNLMAAYDLLGRLHLESGRADEALKVFDQASVISPNSLARHRAIANVAEEMADFSRVEEAMSRVVKKTRNSPLRETADYARLGNALTALGEPDKAVALIEEAKSLRKDDADDPQLAAVEALAQQQAGKPDLAAAALARALKSDPAQQPPAVALAVARACLATGRQDEAEGILKSVVQTHPEASALHGRVSRLLCEHGAADRAEKLVAESIQEVIALNNEAVRRGKAGDLGAAAEMLALAARRLPGNHQIVANAAFALLLDLYSNGMDEDKLRDAARFQQSVQERNPRHPKLADIAGLFVRVRSKYGMDAGK